MAFIAPFVGAALGLGAVGTSLLGAAVGIGLSFAARELRPKQKKSTGSEARGVRVGLQIDTNPPRQFIVGEAATGGSLAYWQLSGTDNSTLWMVIALADHECQSLQKVLINGKEKTRNSTTGEISGYGSKFVIRFYSGADTQTADSELVAASGGRWTNNERGKGICYAVVKLTYDEELFPEGIPEITFVVRGAKLFDPRTSTTAWTANSAVILYNILRGVAPYDEKLIGMNVPAAAIRSAEAIAAANACDENVALKAGGTEKRYSCHAVFDSTQSNRDVIETILATMSGKLISTGGIYRILAGVAQSPVAALTDADIIVTEPVVARPKTGRNELANAVLGSFTDPARGYASVAVPPRTSSADETADGGIRLARSFDLSAVTSRTQAQRVIEIERKRARRQASVAMRIRARHFGLEPGDWVTFNSDRRGYSAKTFEVRSISGARDLTSDIVIGEIDDGIDDWSTTDELDDNQVANLASAGPSMTSVQGITLQNINVTSGVGASAVSRPGLAISWTRIDDPTVTSLLLRYRIVGQTTFLERSILNPTRIDVVAGKQTYSWISEVQGGAVYQAQLLPVFRPSRPATWSAWVTSSSGAAPPQVVAFANTASVAQGLTSAALQNLQSQLEQSIELTVDELLGPTELKLNQIAADLDKVEGRWGAAVTNNGEITGLIKLDGTGGQSQLTVVANKFLVSQPGQTGGTATPVFAVTTGSYTRAYTASGAANATSITLASVANVEVGGAVGGDARIQDGTVVTAVNASTRVVTLSKPITAAMSNARIVIADNRKPRMALRGDMIVDGSITARALDVITLSAISSNIGDATFTGIMRGGPGGKLIIDLTSGRIRGTA